MEDYNVARLKARRQVYKADGAQKSAATRSRSSSSSSSSGKSKRAAEEDDYEGEETEEEYRVTDEHLTAQEKKLQEFNFGIEFCLAAKSGGPSSNTPKTVQVASKTPPKKFAAFGDIVIGIRYKRKNRWWLRIGKIYLPMRIHGKLVLERYRPELLPCYPWKVNDSRDDDVWQGRTQYWNELTGEYTWDLAEAKRYPQKAECEADLMPFQQPFWVSPGVIYVVRTDSYVRREPRKGASWVRHAKAGEQLELFEWDKYDRHATERWRRCGWRAWGPYGWIRLHDTSGAPALTAPLYTEKAQEAGFTLEPLCLAVYENNLDDLRRFIKGPPEATTSELDVRDESGRTPLMLAAQWGHADCCSILIRAGATVDICTSFITTECNTSITAIELAADRTLRELLRFLGGDGDKCDPSLLLAAADMLLPDDPARQQLDKHARLLRKQAREAKIAELREALRREEMRRLEEAERKREADERIRKELEARNKEWDDRRLDRLQRAQEKKQRMEQRAREEQLRMEAQKAREAETAREENMRRLEQSMAEKEKQRKIEYEERMTRLQAERMEKLRREEHRDNNRSRNMPKNGVPDEAAVDQELSSDGARWTCEECGFDSPESSSVCVFCDTARGQGYKAKLWEGWTKPDKNQTWERQEQQQQSGRRKVVVQKAKMAERYVSSSSEDGNSSGDRAGTRSVHV